MADITEQFEQASKDSKTLKEKPSNDDLLFLYSHFKQGSTGDCNTKRPGFTDIIGRAKYDAWKKIEGLSKEDAMQKYINKVEELKSA